MKKLLLTFLAVLAYLSSVTGCMQKENEMTSRSDAFIVVTDYFNNDGTTDVADAIQKVIDTHPNRTIYIPDGTYLLSHPIYTPADPTKAVHLVLGNFAILRAMIGWVEDNAVVRLGGKDPYNSIRICGSNYGIEGGIIDGTGVADGISVDSGRESRINHVSIKNTRIGIHIKHGANNGSSDCDIVDVNIVGNDKPNSIGVLLEGADNTLTNMRIASVNKGVWFKTGGNSLKNIHPLYIFADTQDYPSSVGFYVERDGNNWLDYCYSDQFCVGFKLGKNVAANMTDCFAWWYTGKVASQTAIECDGLFQALVYGMHVGFNKDCPQVTILKADKGGNGVIRNVACNSTSDLSNADVSAFYTK